MIEIKKAQQIQEWQGRMKNSRYAEGVRNLITEGVKKEKSVYECKSNEKQKKGMKIIARFRMGNESRASEFWKKEEEILCRLCKKEKETLKHILEDCEFTDKKERDWRNAVKGVKNSVVELYRITWERKRRNQENRNKV